MTLVQLRRKQKIGVKLSRHFVGTVITNNSRKLMDVEGCLSAVRDILSEHDVVVLGEVAHEFPNKSFTLLVGLAESHISIHTWPERLTVQLDVFLCNYVNDNTAKCESIYDAIAEYFEPFENNQTIIERP